MTLAEKLGQLTMTAAAYAVTGPFVAGDLQAGHPLGRDRQSAQSLWRRCGAKTQRLAVEQTRLGIPLLIGLDVIHGHRTMFPVPLGEASLFDPGLVEPRRAKRRGKRPPTAWH